MRFRVRDIQNNQKKSLLKKNNSGNQSGEQIMDVSEAI